MKRVTKILIIVCCLALCGSVPLLLPKETAKDRVPKTQFAPVNNPQSLRANWIQT